MKLRNKVLISITITWIIFVAIIYLGVNYFLMKSFLNLEADRANQDLGRIDQALDQIQYSLYTYTSDWAHWDDAYDYLLGKNPQFVPNNINITAFIISTINLITYWDQKGNLLFGSMVDTERKKFIPFFKGIEKYIYPGSKFLNQNGKAIDLRGYISIPNGVMMIAAMGVTNGASTKPVLGAMITGKIVSDKILQKVKETTKLELNLFLPKQIKINSSLSDAYKIISQNKTGHFAKPVDEKMLNGYSIIHDINNHPIAMIEMKSPRTIYQTGKHAVNYFLFVVIVMGILFSIIMTKIIRILIVKRLEALEKNVEVISADSKLIARVNASGNDELSTVSGKINQMMDIIQSSQEKLENRVEERTSELKQEIHERKVIEKELIEHKEYLSKLAHYDVLTSLPNRVYFNKILNEQLIIAKESTQRLAIFFIDLDRFKRINDSLGHHIGDEVLKKIALSISKKIRKNDFVARLGGDEFIVLFNNLTNIEFLEDLAKIILSICAKPIKLHSYEFHVSTSIGIAIYPDDGVNLQDLQKNADLAMYKAKHRGGNNFQYYKKEMNLLVAQNMQMESELIKAIKKKEFVLYYQPKIDIKTGTMSGAEALIRWQHPTLGLVSPSQFISLAEDTGLILDIGTWVLHEACKANKSWQREGYKPISVAVNISPRQFKDQDIAKIVATALEEFHLEPQYLEVEITESAVMEDLEAATVKLSEIRKMGVKVSIDDFGTGYNSINYLKQFPVDILKIDQNFIKGIPNTENDCSIVHAIIALSHRLGMGVVAEGVETNEQVQWLADNDCDILQGYFFSRPLPEDKMISELEKEEVYQLD